MAEHLDDGIATHWRLPRERGPNAGWWYAPLAASAAIVVGAIGAALAREPAGLLEGACVPSSHESQGVLLLNVALYLLAPLTVIVGGRALLRGPTAYRIAGGGSILAVAVPFVLLLANFGDYYCSH